MSNTDDPKTGESGKNFQAEVRESAHRIWLAGLGALVAAEEEGSRLFKNLVEKGEELEGKGRDRVSGVMSTVSGAADNVKRDVGTSFDKVGSGLDEVVVRALKQLGVPTREELNTLTKRIEELAESLESLKPPRTTKKTTKKSTTKSTES